MEVFHNCPVSVLAHVQSKVSATIPQYREAYPTVLGELLLNKGSCEFLICCDDMELKSPLKLLGSEVIMSKNFTLDICFLQHTTPRDQLQQKLFLILSN